MNVEIGIEESDRVIIVEGLAKLQGDTYLLSMKAQNYHWNVKGPLFSSLTHLFMEHHNELTEGIENIALRVRMLGHVAPGTLTEYKRLSSLAEGDSAQDAESMIKELIENHESILQDVRPFIKLVEKTNDYATVDLLVRHLTVHAEMAWELRSIIE
ncbi:DNA starvation/stationary phase protection protein [Patescibacteria group bacterium]|nr:DNA starvation/stationary phase protection protein [Patescibacteria group bacterium]